MNRLLMDNVDVLGQAERLLQRLSDAAYQQRFDLLFGGSVGAQLRHALDHYACFLDGLASGGIDYANRRRDPAVEEDRHAALAEIRRVRARLEQVAIAADERTLRLSGDASEDRAPVTSSVGRELEFLASHSVHHLAMIAVMCGLQGIPVEPGFGVARSTLRWWGRSVEYEASA